MGRIAEEREKVQVRLDKIERIFYINGGDLNQYYVLLTRGLMEFALVLGRKRFF